MSYKKRGLANEPAEIRKVTPVDHLTAGRFGFSGSMERCELERAQLAAARQTVEDAIVGSAYYRRRLAAIDPDAFRSLQGFARLPLLDADELRRAGDRLLCVSRSKVARVVTLQTSGSTGVPKRLAFSGADLESTLTFFVEGMHSLVSAADRVLVMLPYTLPDSVGDLLLRAMSQVGIFAAGCWPPGVEQEAARMVRAHRISCVVGLPPHLLALAVERKIGCLKSMLLCSDYAPPPLRRRIETLSGCETFLHYGTTESGLGGGVECGYHEGCHLREADLLVEIVDPESGRQVPDGTVGEVVLTTLGRQAMPLIRYRTGDEASMIRERCRCGGITARLMNIGGRLGGVRLGDGATLSSQQVDDVLFDIPDLLDYRITLDSPKTDRLRLDFVAHGPAGEITQAITRCLQLIPAIAQNIKSGLLTLGPIRRVDSFAAQHTVKRSIVDARRPGERDVDHS